MSSIDERRQVSHLIAGILLLLVGTLFALQNLGMVHAGRLGDYWPLLLVWVGLSRILGPPRGRHFASGVVIVILGIVFQLDRLDLISVSMRDLWPSLLVVAGIALIAESFAARRRNRSGLETDPAQERGGQP